LGINWNQGRKWKSLTKIIVFRDHYSDPKKCKKFPKKSLIKNTWFFLLLLFFFCLANLLFCGFFEQFVAKKYTPDYATRPLLLLQLYANVQSVFNAYQIPFLKKALLAPSTYVNCQKLPFALLSIPLKQNIKSKTYTFQFIL